MQLFKSPGQIFPIFSDCCELFDVVKKKGEMDIFIFLVSIFQMYIMLKLMKCFGCCFLVLNFEVHYVTEE